MLVWFLDLSFFSFMVLGTLIAFCVFYLLLFVSCAVGSIGEKLCWFKKADRIFKAIGLTIFAVSVCILLCSPIVLTYFAYKVAYTRSVKIYSEKVTFGEVWCNYADFKGELCKNYVKYALNEQEIAKQNELERQQAQQVKGA